MTKTKFIQSATVGVLTAVVGFVCFTVMGPAGLAVGGVAWAISNIILR